MKILMVCLGNICRSPIAEGVMQQLVNDAGLDWQVDSAGTNGYHTGEAPHRFSQKVCKAHGYDISNQRSIRFKTRDFETYDVIYVMAKDVYNDVASYVQSPKDMEKVHLFLEDLMPGEKQDVPDPWYGDEAGYKPVFELIEQGCKAILKCLLAKRQID